MIKNIILLSLHSENKQKSIQISKTNKQTLNTSKDNTNKPKQLKQTHFQTIYKLNQHQIEKWYISLIIVISQHSKCKQIFLSLRKQNKNINENKKAQLINKI